MPGRGEQHQARLCSGDAELDPALTLAHRLVGRDLQADLLGPELERLVLVAHRDADELHPLQHGWSRFLVA
jgi:hypothetical protein